MYKNVLLEYLDDMFSSKEMAEYIKENIDAFSKHRVLDMVCAAPISLGHKSCMLAKMSRYESLSESQSDDLFAPPYTIGNCIKELDKARSHLELKQGELFILYEYDSSNNNRIKSTVPLLNYKQLVGYLSQNKEHYNENTWQLLEKWIPNSKGELMNIMDYYIFNRDIVGCRYHGRGEFEGYFEMNSNLNLPVPFKCGDIIEIDSRPIHKKKRAIVVGTGDNHDCCAVQVLFINEAGKLKCGALKHTDIYNPLENDWWYLLSPLYSAKTYDGELEGAEAVFTKIQKFIQENSELWNDVETTLPLHDVTLADITDEYLQDLLQELKFLQKRITARKQMQIVGD